ncbi:calcium:proton antiporter [Rhodanobacter sp. L36]|uniref:calcium:proton antiporter n=1 Tax=Rhodanobacter sp. L36 TaxID=1747221 RepID=UPI00131BCA31|nr:calcium:proton antiporter [Rhodanobacter sp. L36]
MGNRQLRTLLRKEWFLAFSALTSGLFLWFGHRLMDGFVSPLWLVTVFFWLFLTILGSAVAVVQHADCLAERLGEPYGTLILTLSITSIEVMSITAVMLHGDNNPTLARDTLFAVSMVILNGMVGLSLLMGGWRHREQQYNLQGANAYLGVIIPLGVLCLVMPDFTVSTSGPTMSFPQEMFLATVSVVLYAAFLLLQTHRHRGYFVEGEQLVAHAPKKTNAHAAHAPQGKSVLRHTVLLIAYMVPIIYLAEQIGVPVDYVVETVHAPAALAGLTLAILVAAPEAIGAVRAAASNHLQRSVNIFLGSVLATIGLTIPAILIVSHLTHHPIILGLQHTDLMLFVLTLALCLVTFSSGRTNVLQGGVHLVLFVAYLFFTFEG